MVEMGEVEMGGASMLAGHKLVFVGGLHRSGTTPLARVLAEHPDVSGFGATRPTGVTEDEGQHLQDLYPAARAYGGAGRFALPDQRRLVGRGRAQMPVQAIITDIQLPTDEPFGIGQFPLQNFFPRLEPDSSSLAARPQNFSGSRIDSL